MSDTFDPAALRKLLMSATDGPWAIWPDLRPEGLITIGDATGVIPEGETWTDGPSNTVAHVYTEEDADLIAALRNQAWPLLDAYERLSRRLETAEAELAKPVRVVVVLDTRRDRVHSIVGSDAEAQQHVRELVAKYGGDNLAATMTVGLVERKPAVPADTADEPKQCGAVNPHYPTVTCDSVKDHPNLTLGFEVFNHANMRKLSWWNDGDAARVVVRDELLTDTPSLVAEIRHRQEYPHKYEDAVPGADEQTTRAAALHAAYDAVGATHTGPTQYAAPGGIAADETTDGAK